VFSGLSVGATVAAAAYLTEGTGLGLIVTTGVGVLAIVLLLAAAVTGQVASVRIFRLIAPSPLHRVMRVLEMLAGAGLMIVAAGIIYTMISAQRTVDDVPAGTIGLGALMVGLATPRFVMFYQPISRAMRLAGSRGMFSAANWIVVLGWTKAVYEFVWIVLFIAPMCLGNLFGLSGDSHVTVGLGALFGLGGYAVIWVMMMALHSLACTSRSISSNVAGAFQVMPAQGIAIQ